MWRVLGASVAGTSHLKRKSECQDAHAIRILGDSQFAIAVADGAGSAKRAAEGASAASNAVIEDLSRRLQEHSPQTEAQCEELLRWCMENARWRLQSAAEEGPCALSDFATTLLICFADNDWLGIASIGDGAVVLKTNAAPDGNNLELIQPERSSEYLNETDFLTSARALERTLIRVRRLHSIDALAMFTDGVEWAAVRYKERVPHAPFFNPLFAHAISEAATSGDLDEFLSSPRFCEQTDDDKTLVLAVRG